MISPLAMGFSRAILAGYDEHKGVFRGLAALGSDSREENDRLRREIGEEERVLADIGPRPWAGLEPRGEEETLFSQNLRDLSNHSFWITTYQKFSGSTASLLDLVREIEVPLLARPAGPRF